MRTLLQAAQTAPSAEYFKGYRDGLRWVPRDDAETESKEPPAELAEMIVAALEEGYTNGIEALLSYARDGDTIYGRFRDGAKTFGYTLNDDQISYWLLRGTGRTDSFWDRLDQKAGAVKGKSPNEGKGVKCKRGYISPNKECQVKPSPEAKKNIAKAAKLIDPFSPENNPAFSKIGKINAEVDPFSPENNPAFPKTVNTRAEQPKSNKPSSPDPAADIAAIQKSAFRFDLEEALFAVRKPKRSREIVGDATIEEQASIFLYTGMHYEAMNQMLRGQKTIYNGSAEKKAISSMSALAAEGLKKMPKHEGVVYRGADLGSHLQAQYKPGAIVQDAGFMSTSSSRKGAFEGNTQYVIQSKKHGVSVEQLSNIPKEKEVLFPPDTKFRVLNVEKKNGTMTVYMEEA